MTRTILRREKVKQATIALVFVSAAAIRGLNKKYLSRVYATDVLAFNLTGPNEKELTGDVIISTDAAVKNAASFGNTPARELTLYIIHGLLHLLGYDDHKRIDIKKMRKKEEDLLAFIGTKYKAVLNS